jgi:ATP-dependent RNA helicase DDX51/DBP6
LPQTAVSIGEQFSLPDGLDEKMVVVDPALKALVLIYLIHHAEYQVKSTLVFTKSVESATRLVQLLDAFEEVNRTEIVVKTYTSEMKPGERKRLLSEFAKGNIHL